MSLDLYLFIWHFHDKPEIECLNAMRIHIDTGHDVTKHDNFASMHAASFGFNKTLKLLLDNGAGVTNAIIEASTRGHTETVQLLIDHGADVTANENEAIELAHKNGFHEVVSVLISHGASFHPLS